MQKKVLQFLGSVCVVLLCHLSASRLYAQTNVGLSAVCAHTVGGATPYHPGNYNDGVIAAHSGCTSTASPWGWMATNGFISFTWSSAVTFNKVVFYKSNRPMTTCTFQYWNGSAYVNFYTYSGTTCTQDSVTFPSVTTTILRFNNCAGSTNPNFREIQVWLTAPSPPSVTGSTVYCAGNTISLTASSPAPSPVFTWTGPGSFSATGPTITIPSASAANAGTYSCIVTSGGSPSTPTTTAVVVNPLPAAITGSATVCQGLTSALSSATAGGTWISSNGSIATVAGSGPSATLNGISAGNANITYKLTSTGCETIRIATVNALPTISGIASICEGGASTLTGTPAGGTWISSNGSIVTVGASSGILTGVSGGIAGIVYTGTNTCQQSRLATVNALPAVTLSSSSATLCLNDATTVAATSPPTQLALLNQDFNSGLAGWAITNVAGSAASYWQVITGTGVSGFAGDGTPYLQAASSAYLSGPTTTTITSPSFSTQGSYDGITLSFNQYLFSFTPDAAASIEYSINGGSTWTTIVNQALMMIPDAGDDGSWNAATPEFSMALPAGAVGQPNVRLRWHYSGQSLYWLIDNIKVRAIMPGSTFAWTGAAGLSCTACTDPVITPSVTGTSIYDLAVISSAGCIVNTPFTVIVNPLPSAITGGLVVCENVTNTMSSLPVGGIWSISDVSKATITSGTGMLTGVAAGNANISYTLPTTGCRITATTTVLPAPSAISPATVAICDGNYANLSATPAGGTWNSSMPTVATVGFTGTVGGMSPGISDITYTIPSGCVSVRTVTVNALPAAISGPSAVCVDASVTFTNTDLFGSWSSSNTLIATVSAAGAVTGVSGGFAYITYTSPTGCYAIKPIQVNVLPDPSTGPSAVCVGGTAVVSNSSGGGFWNSSAPGIASVSSSGIITAGSLAGAANILYTFVSTGCSAVHPFVVNPAPSALTGVQKVCKDAFTTFASASPFGTWSSGNPSIAAIDAAGVVNGVAVGNTVITYTLPTGCIGTRTVTVNALPNAIGGAAAVCQGSTIALTNTTPLGTWSSGDVAVAGISASGVVSPAAASGAVTISYIVTATGCYSTRDIVINPLPAPIAGPTTLCANGATTFSSGTTGGTWASSNTSVMLIDAATGAANALIQGTANVTYTLPTGCRVATGILVNPVPAAITGTASVCQGRQTTLFNATPSGNWSSSDGGIASVSSTGVVTGNLAGMATISYTLATGCYRTETFNVKALAAPILGNTSVCLGSVSVLTNADADGTWSSSHPSIASVNVLGGVTGNATGGATITYTLPTGCMRTQGVVVNPLPANISGTAVVCEGKVTGFTNSSPGGTWSSLSSTIASVDEHTGIVTGQSAGFTNIIYTLPTTCSRSRLVTVNATPAPISGPLSGCSGQTSIVSGSPAGGAWSSTAATVAYVNAAGIVTSGTAGTSTISYTMPTGCRSMATFVVHALPAVIGGNRVLCKDGSTSLTSSPSGGTWSVTEPTFVSIDAVTGDAIALAAGNTTVSYTSPEGCVRTAPFVVNPLPQDIGGPLTVCQSFTANLTNATNGGAWTSSNTGVAGITAAGTVSGVSAGVATITYTLPTGCRTTTNFEVFARPDDIAGSPAMCLGQQTTLFNGTANGVWSSANNGIATVDVNGQVTGQGNGSTTIVYTLPTGCFKSKAVVVNPLPATITGNMGICHGSISALANATPGGSWSSTNPSVVNISSSGSASGLQVGFSVINYTLPTGCSANTSVVVHPVPEPITGTAVLCAGNITTLETVTTGGTWSTTSTAMQVSSTGVVTGVAAGTGNIVYTTGNGCKRSRAVVVNPLPGLITGATAICPGLSAAVGNSMPGGVWTTDNTDVLTVNASGTVAAVSTTGGSANITYTLPTGCQRSRAITIHPTVAAITGETTICKGATSTLANATAGGVWTSDNSLAITADAGTGIMTGAGAGVATVAYVIPATGCRSQVTMLVNPLPGNISGAAAVCASAATTLGNTVPGGAWTSGDETIATVAATGAVTGVAEGVTTITYKLATGCMATRDIAVNALPQLKATTGGGSYCAGSAGVAIGLDGSQAGTIYKLMNGGTEPLTTVTSTGGLINFGNYTGAGIYTVVAVSPEGCMRSMAGNPTVTVNALVTPAVILSSAEGSTVCAGTMVAYTATGSNGGTAPSYVWRVNGVDVGTAASYSYIPVDGDVVSVRYTSNAICPSPASVSGVMNMVVRANLTPAVTVSAGPADTLCDGTTATFSANAVNGGSAPMYSWLINGVPVAGASSSVYAYKPVNNDAVVCKLTSSSTCLTANNVASTNVVMHIDPVYIPVVAVTANPGTTATEGTEVVFTANATNAGPAPTYQWLINSTQVGGALNPVFKTASLKDGDSVTCRVTGSGECGEPTINSVVMHIVPATTGVAASVIGNSEIRLIPNPNNGTFNLTGTLAGNSNEDVAIEVTDMLGQVVYRGSATARGGVINAPVSLGNNLANGMYMLNMVVGAERKAFHFVVKQ